LLFAPTRGSIHLHLGDRALTVSQATIADRRRLAMVFQRPSLLSRSVRDNIAYGLSLRGQTADPRRIDDMLGRLGLTHLAGKPASSLSGGEIQRTALGRALVLDPDVLLLDEPTANLDPASGALIEDMIRQTHDQRRTTIVLVTHNLFQARRLATRAMLLIGSQLIEESAADALFDHPSDPRTARFISGDMTF
jgi:tungstate transport system ATP-binding protein